MNTLNKILRCHSEIFSPHKQLIEFLSINKKLYLAFSLYLIEVGLSQYFLFNNKNIWALVLLVIFLITVGITSYLNFKYIENVYGSVEKLDIDRNNRFIQLVKDKTNIDLVNLEENLIVNEMIKEKIEKIYKSNQSKRSLYQGTFLTSIPLVVQFFMQNIELLTLGITLIGLVILFIASKKALKEYSLISKLEHTNELLKEIRLNSLISNRQNGFNLEEIS